MLRERSTRREARALRRWVARRPVVAFFVLAYACSWLFWAPAALGYDAPIAQLAIFVGVWGPAVAGLTVTALLGRSVRDWIRGMLRWRVPLRWYAFALLVPAVVVAVVSVAFVALGGELDTGLLGERLAVYLPMLVVMTLLAGGNEEWGWRGFALPELLERHRPVAATLVLGSLWAVWHLPLLAAQEDLSHGLDGIELAAVLAATAINIVGLALFYTFLYLKTRSTLLAALLHGSFNAANGTLVLREEIEGSAYATMQYCITIATLLVATLLVWAWSDRERTATKAGPSDGDRQVAAPRAPDRPVPVG